VIKAKDAYGNETCGAPVSKYVITINGNMENYIIISCKLPTYSSWP
jgi:hypothetical protein